jgi:hypothetical protein
MAGSAEAFRRAKISVYQILLSDREGAGHMEPRTREDWLLDRHADFAKAS